MMESSFTGRFAGRSALPCGALSLVGRFSGRRVGQLKIGGIY